ncbi:MULTISPECIES: acetoacetate decarboxylase family protein [unclassified Ensifer]|uniref:acetoacetate decarboxylase family protein n=1 Tax=unclassified Ensifer TaxID=2633371 RepID=UPI0008133998|nr:MULTISPECIES: acetoacetate decarboxylase family protein [unclassified Ensifer]OCP23602.1 acetoacetate decarboxylase [Ensifer sp. LC384]OCP24289.1 acetoacetate decarboxylase [Ensifer sp. LC54]
MDKFMAEVEFGGQKVEVPAGGYYDRFRMNPDLGEIARDPKAGNIDFFRRIPKQQVATRVGPTWAPNFYYRSNSVQLLFLAPVDRLRATLPQPLEPLRAFPGHGLVALTFFSYSVCDNDPYNEVSVAVVIRQPDAQRSHALELLKDIKRRSFFAHVLALPVNTEIARVRGVYGYQLPKWLAEIDVSIGTDVRASIASNDGKQDLILSTPLPALKTVPSQSRMGTNTMIHLIDGQWHQTVVQTNTISFAQKLFPKGVSLTRSGGPLSELLDGLGVSTILRLDVVKDAQLVLNMPTPLKGFGRALS